MSDPLLKSYTSGLSVLFVEDDPVGAAIIQKMLEPLFARVYAAHNGAEGLRQFHLKQPDLLVSDLMMPVMDGIDMLREMRKSNQKVPVILMTASLEHVHLVEAINLGVSKFLAKPLRVDALRRALLGVTRELYLERVAEQARQQEVELLTFRNRYHSQQQELARAKERHIAHDFLGNRYLQGSGGSGWLVDLLQQPRDIMSGDSYSIIPAEQNRLLIFMADAMGHGLSASVTSMLTTAFFNHAAQGCACSHLGFTHLANSTMQFAKRNLLEDEVFSGLVLELDPERETIRFACCGMPALLLVRHGQVERLRGLNPPVSAFSPPVQLQEFALAGVSDILLATDGLGDAEMRDGGSFRELLPQMLAETATVRELFSRYATACDDSANDDDITIIRLSRTGPVQGQQLQYTCPGSLAGIENLQVQIREVLEAAGASGEALDNLEIAVSEALMNAFEHGCLKIGADKKRLILEGSYDDFLLSAGGRSDDSISVSVSFSHRSDRLQVWLAVTDPGEGFDGGLHPDKIRSQAPSGRGFLMMQRSVGLVRRTQAGNGVILMQMFERTE